MINAKKLQQKLEKKTQQIIEDVVCDKCGNPVVYILLGRGTAVGEVRYEVFDSDKISVTNQNGEWHEGYKNHICKK